MKPEEILINIWEPSPFGSKYIEDLQLAITLNPDLDRIIEAMEDFGKQCFDAAREIECTTVGDIDDIPGVVHSNKFINFEDYLKSLGNDN